MGKKLQGAALRAKKRARAALEDLQEHQAEAAESYAQAPDEELFVLDTQGNTEPPRKKPKERRNPKETVSNTDEEAVEQLLQKYTPEQLQEMARPTKPRIQATAKPHYDLWFDEKPDISKAKGEKSSATASKSKTAAPKTNELLKNNKKKVAIDVAKDGQSYFPDPVSHQTVIQSAVQVELQRDKAQRERDAPISEGMSAETRALLIYDSDTSDESDHEEERDHDTEADYSLAVGPLPKRANKKTRAQRNKEKRLKRERAAIDKRRQEKKFINAVGEIGRYQKEMKRQVREREELQKQRELTASKVPALGTQLDQKLGQANPLKAPTLSVALPSELQAGSLRTLKPKGSLASERLASLIDRNLMAKPTNNPNHCRGKRRKKSLKGHRNKLGVEGCTVDIKG